MSYVKNLSGSGRKQVSIGKDVYEVTAGLVSLHGLVPPAISRRVQGISESGIWELHSKLANIEHDFESGPETDAPTKATMKGNVLIIFLLLPAGFVFAGFRLSLELFMFRVTRNKCKYDCMHFINAHLYVKYFLRGVIRNMKVIINMIYKMVTRFENSLRTIL